VPPVDGALLIFRVSFSPKDLFFAETLASRGTDGKSLRKILEKKSREIETILQSQVLI